MIVTLLKLGLLLLSYLGYWEFFRGRCRMNVYFAPAFTIAAQFAVMFLPGLLNFLPEAVWALYLGGFVLLIDALRREKLGFVRHYINWGYALLFLALAVMALAFRGKIVTWFDNFTHWAVAVKNMLAADRFPTFAQEAVTFTTYPLGSTAMIYYFCRFTSSEEDFWMLAQGFMLLCMLLPMFACGKKNGFISAIFLALMGNFLLCYNIPLTELLVDTLLPLAGAAMLLFLHRECLREEAPLSAYFALPILFWVMNIKNAGLLLVVTGVGLLLWYSKKQGRETKPVIVTALILLSGYFLWERHCDYVFYNNTISQHEISLDYFSIHLGEKTLADAWQIICLTAQAMVFRRELLYVLGLLAVLWVLTWLLAPQRKKQLRDLTAFLGISFVVYAVSLMAMYISSMSLMAALELQSIDRYIRIWEILAFYLMAVYAAALMTGVRQERLVSLLLTAAMACVWVGYYGGVRTIAQPQYYGTEARYDPAERLRYEAPIAEYGVQPGYAYLICAEDNVLWYPAFLWAYHLDSNDIMQIKVTEEAQLDIEKNYDYVVILDEDNPVIEGWVEKAYPDQAGRTVIQCFK